MSFLCSLFLSPSVITIKTWFFRLLLLSTFLVLTSNFSIATENNREKVNNEITDPDEFYAGVFVGSGKVYNKHTDVEGFANWGHPDSSVDYDDTEPVFGVLIGKEVNINDISLRFELDGTFGDISASTNQIDPEGLDETAKKNVMWIITARAGLATDFGPATVFVNGGLALAQIRYSITDMDYMPDGSQQRDPDDSYQNDLIQVGLVVGLGVEVPLENDTRSLHDAEVWTLLIEGSYYDFGKDTYTINHSGNNSCGPGGPRRPCYYNEETKLGILRLAIVHKFSF